MKKILFLVLLLVPMAGFAVHELENRDLVNGQRHYEQHCGSCHGMNLEGQPDWQSPGPDGVLPAPPHDVTGHTWHHDNQMLFNYTKYGGMAYFATLGLTDIKSGMEGFGHALTNDEIWDILAYIRSTWPARVQQIQDSRNPPH